VILEFVARETLNLELWLEDMRICNLEGYFVNFSGARNLSGIIFQEPGV
jgi:hypothetical protein